MYNILCWTARVWSIFSLGLLLLFIFGEGFEKVPTLTEAIGMLFFPFGMSIGLLLGWRNELWGGTIAVLSLALFYLWNFIEGGYFPKGPWFLALVAPGFLFVAAGLLKKTSSQ